MSQDAIEQVVLRGFIQTFQFLPFLFFKVLYIHTQNIIIHFYKQKITFTEGVIFIIRS